MEKKLKEFIGDRVEYDGYGTYIWGVKDPLGDKELQMLADVRGWGAIQNLFRGQGEEEAMKFQDALGNFIADAINEKLDRENGKIEP